MKIEAKQNALPDHDSISGQREECYRCGYNLLGIDDEQPCPECGLLARRSRRATDELHETRPWWLRSIARGVWLILLALVLAAAWPFLVEPLLILYWRHVGQQNFAALSRAYRLAPLLGFGASAITLFIGVLLLTAREGYRPANHADRWRRCALRLVALMPLVAMALEFIDIEFMTRAMWGSPRWSDLDLAAVLLITIGCVPLPLLLFLQLRSLAKRARSAHLAEHCAIVGIGTSAALLYVPIVIYIFERAETWGWGENWTNKSNASLLLVLLVAVAAALFVLWSLYLLIRFAIAFRRALRIMRAKWMLDDRAV